MLCSGNTVYVYREPFEQQLIQLRVNCSSAITCVSGVWEASTCILFFGHYNGSISSVRLHFGSWLKHERLNVTMERVNSKREGIDTNTCMNNYQAQRRFPILKLRIVKFDQSRGSTSDSQQSLFSSQSMTNRSSFLNKVSLSVLSADDTVVMYHIDEGYLDEISLKESLTFGGPLLSLDLKVVPMNNYALRVSETAQGTSKNPSHALFVAGTNCVDILFTNQERLLNRIRCSTSPGQTNNLTFTTSVCTRNENSCDMALFAGSTEGLLFRARIT